MNPPYRWNRHLESPPRRPRRPRGQDGTVLERPPAGFRKLIAWIGPETARVAYEPSGPWHRDFEDALLKAGLPLYAINPYHVRCFARSRGRRAKTDAVDARMLATMAAAIDNLRPPDNQLPSRVNRGSPRVTVRSGRGEVFCRAGRGRAGLSG